jgi:hypothetical protein
MSNGWNREQMAARAAQDIPDGSYVNLGIGIPELVAKFVPEGRVLLLVDAAVDGVIVGGMAARFGDLAGDVFAGEITAGGAVAVAAIALEGGRTARWIDSAGQQQRVVGEVNGAEGDG